MKFLFIIFLVVSCKGQDASKLIEQVSKKEYLEVEGSGSVYATLDNEYSTALGLELDYNCKNEKCDISGNVFAYRTPTSVTEFNIKFSDLKYIGNGYYKGYILSTNDIQSNIVFSPERGYLRAEAASACASNVRTSSRQKMEDFLRNLPHELIQGSLSLYGDHKAGCPYKE